MHCGVLEQDRCHKKIVLGKTLYLYRKLIKLGTMQCRVLGQSGEKFSP